MTCARRSVGQISAAEWREAVGSDWPELAAEFLQPGVLPDWEAMFEVRWREEVRDDG